MLAPVTEEGLFDEGFKMAAAVQVQNEASVENLVDVENSAMVRPTVCNVSCTLCDKIERDTPTSNLCNVFWRRAPIGT